MALEPQWEVRFEPTTYGFRPKRSCHDAIERIFKSCVHGKKKWIFEGDFKGCFDNLNHEYIMEQVRCFPYKDVIGKWLKSGYVDNKVFHETEAGSGQGSILSPLLANIALEGMEEALGIKYKEWLRNDGYKVIANKSKYSLSKYADDFVIMCETQKDAIEIYEILQPYLTKRGLELALDKTRVIPITEGFDFLGFNIRRYRTAQGEKLLIKPSQESVKKSKRQISERVRELNGNNVGKVIEILNPIITGKANYWSPEVSKKTFQSMDNHIYWCTYKFLRRLHREKPSKWIKARYYKADRTGQSKRKWILTDPVKESQLKMMTWTPIVRHTLVSHKASPYDTTLKEYYINREIKEFSRNNIASRQKLAKLQGYKCPLCKTSITDTDEKLKVKQKIPIVQGGTQQYKNLQLVHKNCNTEYYKRFPEKGTLPNLKQIKEYCKIIKNMKLAALI